MLLPAFLTGQVKHDNTIIVKGATLKQAINTFMDAGFSIDKYDTVMNYAYTVPQRMGASTVIYMARIKDSLLIMTGKFRLDVQLQLFRDVKTNNASDFWPVELRGEKRSDFMLTWNAMNKMAKSLDKPLTYEKR